ncbi:MAG: hypothetical protein WD076_07320 [Parvularculaceae bacterium]
MLGNADYLIETDLQAFALLAIKLGIVPALVVVECKLHELDERIAQRFLQIAFRLKTQAEQLIVRQLIAGRDAHKRPDDFFDVSIHGLLSAPTSLGQHGES